MTHIDSFFAEQGLSPNRPAARLNEGFETGHQVFKNLFAAPFEPLQPLKFGEVPEPEEGMGRVAKMRKSEVDIGSLKEKRAVQRHASMIQAHETEKQGGELKIFRIENMAKVELDPSMHGQFYDGDCYIVCHTWKEGSGVGREHCVIYIWQGPESSIDERGASAIMTVQIDTEDYGGRASQVHVTGGKEEESFLVLFHGAMIIHHGGVASGFKHHSWTPEDGPETETPKQRLYHVHGSNELNTKAQQCNCKASHLHSNDVFVLVREGSAPLLWRGKGASEEEVKVGQKIATILAPAAHGADILQEEAETDEFWACLGGKGPYASDPVMADPDYEPRLFQVSNATGALRIEEAFYFTQEDLVNDDVMLLDTYSHVYIWVGSESNQTEQAEAPNIAREYIQTADDGRSADGSFIIVKAGIEPPLFTCHFLQWDHERQERLAAGPVDLYKERMAKVSLDRQATETLKDQAMDKEGAARASRVEQADADRLQKKLKQQQEPSVRQSSFSETVSLKPAGSSERPSVVAQARAEPPSVEAGTSSTPHAGNPHYLGFRTTDPDILRKHAAERNKGSSEDINSFDYAPFTKVYAYEVLQGASNRPEDVDPKRKEQYLADAEFAKMFGVSKEEFLKQPVWKQKTAKTAKGLF